MKKREMNYYLQSAKEIPEKTPFKRVGIIPYFQQGTEIFLFLMLDSKFNELTDCGGLPKPRENWIDTAIRETDEESRSFFTFKKDCILNRGSVFWREDHRIAIVFMDVTCMITSKEEAAAFCYKYRLSYFRGIAQKDKRHRLENSDMFFYSTDEILSLAKYTKSIYFPVKMLLLKFMKTQFESSIRVPTSKSYTGPMRSQINASTKSQLSVSSVKIFLHSMIINENSEESNHPIDFHSSFSENISM